MIICKILMALAIPIILGISFVKNIETKERLQPLLLIPIGFGLGIILDMPTVTVTADASETDPVEDSVEAKIIGPFVLFQ